MRHLGRIGLVVMAAAVIVGAVGSAARANVPSHIDGLIAFQRNADASGQIWVMDPTAASPEGSAVKVTTGSEAEARPAYGPTVDNDSWVLAFQRFTNGSWDIWRRDATGTAGGTTQFDAAVPLVTAPGDQTAPAYSRVLRDVPLLAYTSNQTGQREIWLRDTAGSLTQLTTDGAGYANPDFAARFRPFDVDGDGTFDRWRIGLAFESTLAGSRAIWALDIEVDADGKYVAKHDLRRVVWGPGDLFEPSWQLTRDRDFNDPDSVVTSRLNDILFTTAQAGTTYLDYVEEPWTEDDTGAVTPPVPFANPAAIARFPLSGNPGADDGAVWAPNGDRVAFTRTTASNSDIWVMAADGTNLRRLTSSGGPEHHPSWQPGSESSVDKVGGHTSPGPVTRGDPGAGNSTSGGGGGGAARISPRLGITRAHWAGRKVRVAGRAASRLHGRLRVAFSCGRRSGQRTVRLVLPRVGRFGTTLPARRPCWRARRGLLTVAYGGDSHYLADHVSRRVRRR
jgi:hypothetical protein